MTITQLNKNVQEIIKITIIELSQKIRYHETMLAAGASKTYHQNLIDLYTNKSLRLIKNQ
jgi:hypothetical protein